MDFKKLVAEFQALCDNFSDLIEIDEAELSWDKEIPFSGSPGTYIIFSEDKKFAYVGQSQVAMGLEVWKYVDRDINWKNSPGFLPKPKSVLCFGLKENMRFFARAFESFLIWTLAKTGTKLLNKRL